MKEEPIIRFDGNNGKIELYKNFVRFDRGTFLGFIEQGLKGIKDIPFKHITSIQIKKPGIMIAGYLQFSIPGGNESRRGITASARDENTITFNGKDKYEKALKIKEYIQKKSHNNNSKSLGMAKEIEQLHGLMKKGILTKEEFEKKKRKLLD